MTAPGWDPMAAMADWMDPIDWHCVMGLALFLSISSISYLFAIDAVAAELPPKLWRTDIGLRRMIEPTGRNRLPVTFSSSRVNERDQTGGSSADADAPDIGRNEAFAICVMCLLYKPIGWR